jgi:hypothetical protein
MLLQRADVKPQHGDVAPMWSIAAPDEAVLFLPPALARFGDHIDLSFQPPVTLVRLCCALTL